MASKKITIEELTTILTATVDDEVEKQRILAEVRNYIANQEDVPTDPTADALETRDVTILFGEQEVLDQIDAGSIVAFTVKIDAAADHNRIIPHLLAKAGIYNNDLGGRSRRQRLTRLGEVFGALSPKRHLESFPKKILNKEPALVVLTTNLPVPTATPAGR